MENNENKSSSKPQLKKISIETKMKILKSLDEGKKIMEISHLYNLHESTVRTIKRNRMKIEMSAVNLSSTTSTKVSRCRHPLIHKTETLLYTWICDKREKGSCLSSLMIQNKASSLFDYLKAQDHSTDPDAVKFSASKGWFEKYKKRFNIKNVRLQGESVGGEISAAACFIREFDEVLKRDNFSAKQIFNADETRLFWKKIPNISFDDDQKSSVFKAHDDGLTLLLGGNVYGDVKLKPLLVFNSHKPDALLNTNINELPVIRKNNSIGWVTRNIFLEWFNDYFVPFVEQYNFDNNLENKALLLIDNAPGHPPDLGLHTPHIRVMYLPPDTSSILQPMNQGVISNFKSFYLQETLKRFSLAIENKVETPTSYWKKYDIETALSNIECAWKEVSMLMLNRAWKKLLPDYVHDIKTQKDEEGSLYLENLPQMSGMKNITQKDIDIFLNYNNEELSNDELLKLEFESFEESPEDPSDRERAKKKKLSIIFKKADELKAGVSEFENDERRSKAFEATIDGMIGYYRDIYNEIND